MSTISPPNSARYTAKELFAAGGIAAGMEVAAGALATIADNNNFCYTAFRGPLGHTVWGTGPHAGYTETTGDPPVTTYNAAEEDLISWFIPGSRNRRDYLITVWARHTDATKDAGTITIRHAGSADLGTITVAAGAALAKYELTVSSPTALDMTMLVQCDSYYTEITTAAVCRKRLVSGGTVSDLPTGSGFMFSRSGNLSNTEPLRDEWVNRMINNPRKLWEDEQHSMVCINTPVRQWTVTNGGIAAWAQDVGSGLPWGPCGAVAATGLQDPVAVFPFLPRFKQTVRIYSYLIAPTGSTLRVHLGTESATLAISGTARPAVGAAPTWRTADVDVQPGTPVGRIYIDGSRSTDPADYGYLLGFQIVGVG